MLIVSLQARAVVSASTAIGSAASRPSQAAACAGVDRWRRSPITMVFAISSGHKEGTTARLCTPDAEIPTADSNP